MLNITYMSTIFNIIMIIVPIFIFLGIIFGLMMFFSAKFRSKFINNQVKGMSNNLEETMTRLGSISIKSQNNIINQNEEFLQNIANKQAEINKNAVKTTAQAIKEGLSSVSLIYCKHCGSNIESDSKFCKFCGKQL